jgi:hypothetical protein
MPLRTSADAGCFSEDITSAAVESGTDPYIALGRTKHPESPPRRGPLAPLTTKQRMRRKLATKKGKAVYARRKAIVEPVSGRMKAARGLRRFLMRGLEKVQGEWSLMCTTHDLLKLRKAAAATA